MDVRRELLKVEDTGHRARVRERRKKNMVWIVHDKIL